jgi:hypothetical protein
LADGEIEGRHAIDTDEQYVLDLFTLGVENGGHGGGQTKGDHPGVQL